MYLDDEEPVDEEDEEFEEADDEEPEEEPVEDQPERGRPRRGSGDLSATTAGQIGLRLIAQLTGREVEGVTLVKPEEDGWQVGVEVVEDRRIPSAGDILALYEIELDEEGDLVSYRRLRRYRRGSGDLGEASQ